MSWSDGAWAQLYQHYVARHAVGMRWLGARRVLWCDYCKKEFS